MDNNEDVTRKPARLTMGNHQLVIITQLLQIVGSMHHIDELFLWLSHIIIQRLNVQVIQFWAMQAGTTGQTSSELRTTASQDTLLPHYIMFNKPLAEIADHLLYEQRSIPPQPMGKAFSQQHINLLTHYNLNYWASHYMNHAILLPPTDNDAAHTKTATPFAITVLLFLQDMPSARLMPTLNSILEQIIPIATNHGLLYTTAQRTRSRHTSTQRSVRHLTLAELIPHRTQENNDPIANSPFSRAVVIQDKMARRLYFAIDGHKNIAELSVSTQLNKQEIYDALHLLIAQNHIHIYEAEGLRLDNTKLLKLL